MPETSHKVKEKVHTSISHGARGRTRAHDVDSKQRWLPAWSRSWPFLPLAPLVLQRARRDGDARNYSVTPRIQVVLIYGFWAPKSLNNDYLDP